MYSETEIICQSFVTLRQFFLFVKNYMYVKVEDHLIKVENNMEIEFRKTSPAKIEPLQIVKHEFN